MTATDADPAAAAETAETGAKPGLLALLRAHPGGAGALLGAFCFASALTLSLADQLTRDAIAQRAAEDLQASLTQVIPPALHDNDPGAQLRHVADPAEGPTAVHIAATGGQVTAVAFELTGYGYGGAIKVLVGLSPAGEVLGARVLAHAETPGLGDKIEAAKADWIFDFDGRSLASLPKEDWALKRDGGVFDQFSGASITPRAVVTTVRRALELFGRNRAALTAHLTPEEKAPGADGEESGSCQITPASPATGFGTTTWSWASCWRCARCWR